LLEASEEVVSTTAGAPHMLTVKIPTAAGREPDLARFDSASDGGTTARFDSSSSDGSATSDGTPSEAGEPAGDEGRPATEGCDDARSVEDGEGEGGDECSSGRTTPRLGYTSPDNTSPDADAKRSNATRRSSREPKPQRPWVSAMSQPLLKWEKEQQAQKSRPKRRSGGRPGDELGFETDSGEELVNQLIPGGLLEESVLDLVFGDQPKRQRC